MFVGCFKIGRGAIKVQLGLPGLSFTSYKGFQGDIKRSDGLELASVFSTQADPMDRILVVGSKSRFNSWLARNDLTKLQKTLRLRID